MGRGRSTRWGWVVLALAGLVACSQVTISGRQQLSLIPASQLNAMSFDQYAKVLKDSEVIQHGRDAEMVRRVGQRIQRAVEQHFADLGQSDQLADYAWEFNLVKDDQVNAWCMPGGKVVVYTGILSKTQTEDGLAVVLGHEVAHAVANHGGERMSQQMLLKMGGQALSLSMGSPQARQVFDNLYGIGAQVGVLLPFSRMHEAEADRLGLTFMSMGGFNPEEAIPFWARMSEGEGEASVLDLVRTHPTGADRVENIRAHLPEALEQYRKTRSF